MLHEGKGHVRSIPQLGRGALAANGFKEVTLDLTKRPRISMLPVSERPPESEYARAPKRTENNNRGFLRVTEDPCYVAKTAPKGRFLSVIIM